MKHDFTYTTIKRVFEHCLFLFVKKSYFNNVKVRRNALTDHVPLYRSSFA